MTHPRTAARQNREAFTLIELLVVIAIISILAAILFPVFAQARGKVRQAANVSNLKQIGTAILMYAQDYDETWVPYATNRAGGGSVWWHGLSTAAPVVYRREDGLLQPYMKNVEIQDCPVGKELPSGFPTWTNGQLVPAFGTNMSLFRQDYLEGPVLKPLIPAPMADIQEPANTMAMVDAVNAVNPSNLTKSFFVTAPWSRRIDGTFQDNGGTAGNSAVRVHGRHVGNVACALWADGHVTVVRPRYRPGAAGSISDRRRLRHVGELCPIDPPATITEGDPNLARYNYFFALNKQTGI